MNPILSIVIANYNYGRFLEEAIRSVLSQIGEGKNQVRSGEVELIIIDGGSTDNSVDVIKKYANGLPPDHLSSKLYPLRSSSITYWVSEPDKGQSDAFNKGFARARGKYLTWLNADDVLVSGSLRKILLQMKCHPECEWFTGNMFRFTEDGSFVECPWGPHWIPRCLQGKGMPIAVYGPTSFFAKRIFDEAGGMKTCQHFMMDTDLWMRFVMMGVMQRRINCFCWAFRMHADSKTAEFGGHQLSEEKKRLFELEAQECLKQTGYCCSRTIRVLLLVFRILDGSLLVKCWYSLSRKRIREVLT